MYTVFDLRKQVYFVTRRLQLRRGMENCLDTQYGGGHQLMELWLAEQTLAWSLQQFEGKLLNMRLRS